MSLVKEGRMSANKQIETSRDTYFMSQIGGRDYVGTVSPLFFTHFGYKVCVSLRSKSSLLELGLERR